MKRILINFGLIISVLAMINSCAEKKASEEKVTSNLIDQNATKETHQLYNQLKEMSSQSLMFGMHDAMGYGVGWSNDDRRCDVKDVCGDYPAVFSWDFLTMFENETEAARMLDRMKFAYNSGGINTICWHFRDYEKNSFYADGLGYEAFPALLPGGKYHENYKISLIEIAEFVQKCRGKNGELIPIIFRPFHEQNGSWFWWGKGHRTEQQYIDLWQFTVTYLRDTLEVHNFIYAFSPDGNQWENKAEYLVDYPGDEYVDMYGVDFYFPSGDDATISRFKQRCQHVVEYAQEKNKVAAVTEAGSRKDWQLSELAIPNWFTKCLLAPIKEDEIAKNVSFACVWRNASTDHHFAPYPGHSSVPDFMEFYKDEFTIFLEDLKK